jgi:hypothetical protein
VKRNDKTLFFLKRKNGMLFFSEPKRNEKKSETERKQIFKVVKRNETERNEKFEKRNETKRQKIITFHKPLTKIKFQRRENGFSQHTFFFSIFSRIK